MKPGGRVFRNILEHGYEGILRPVNPKAGEIHGVPVCSSIAALPETPDLAIVTIPSSMVPAAITELAERGTGVVIILTSGFGEKRMPRARRLKKICGKSPTQWEWP